MNETLHEVLPQVIKALMNGVHTALPAKIDSYDRDKNRAEVTPLISHLTVKNEEVEIPKIVDVPVMIFGGVTGLIDIELQKGDNVLLIFCESGMGGWKSSTGARQVSPDNLAKHALSDAIAIPCIIPDGKISDYTKVPRIKIDTDKTITLDNTVGTIVMDGTTGQANINDNFTVDV